MPYKVEYIDKGWVDVINDAPNQAVLEEIAGKFIVEANALYETMSKHEDIPPILYVDSWKVTRYLHPDFSLHTFPNVLFGRYIGNTDWTAEWVEWGAHAGGKTPVLGYRIMGRTIDILESGA